MVNNLKSENIFKAYDVRGKFPEEINVENAVKISNAFAIFMKAGTIVVGHDMRESSAIIHKEIVSALSKTGLRVFDIGLTSTPMHYFATPFLKADCGIMVTASHNPIEYSGLKFIDANVTPIFIENGLKEVEELSEKDLIVKSGGVVEKVSVEEAYVSFLKQKLSNDIKPFKVVMDSMHGSIGPIVKKVFEDSTLDVKFLSIEPDGRIPGYKTPNPLLEENRRYIEQAMEEEKAELGFMWDADGDRLVVLDCNGIQINSAFVAAIIAKEILEGKASKKIVTEFKMNRILSDLLSAEGIEFIRTKNGNPYIKYKMDRTGASFGAETSGHYMFSVSNNAEDTILAAIFFLKALSKEDKSPIEIFDELRSRYFVSDEISFEIKDQDILTKVKAQFNHEGELDEIEGITIENEEAWFNLRKSTTEPLVRLTVQAQTKEAMEFKVNEVENFIKSLGGVLSDH